VLVLDEPTVGLDPVLRAELWQTFHRLASEGSTSLIETGEEDLSRAFLALNQELWGVSLRVTWAIAPRVLWQIRRDPRTIALLLVVPVLLLVLLKYVFAGRPSVFATIGVPLCGLFPFIVMFLITSIAMLRERTSGTLWALPLTYSYDALARATGPSPLGSWFAFDVLVTIACTIAALALGAATLERRTA
jgi:hypothetical protein